jgi:hypothetical protein
MPLVAALCILHIHHFADSKVHHCFVLRHRLLRTPVPCLLRPMPPARKRPRTTEVITEEAREDLSSRTKALGEMYCRIMDHITERISGRAGTGPGVSSWLMGEIGHPATNADRCVGWAQASAQLLNIQQTTPYLRSLEEARAVHKMAPFQLCWHSAAGYSTASAEEELTMICLVLQRGFQSDPTAGSAACFQMWGGHQC